jgi:hypothetical protein
MTTWNRVSSSLAVRSAVLFVATTLLALGLALHQDQAAAAVSVCNGYECDGPFACVYSPDRTCCLSAEECITYDCATAPLSCPE